MRAALLSVSDQRGLAEFARGLSAAGFTLLATDGTARALGDAGISCTGVGEYTGQPEILDGRVKTLHPRIHAGILARRDKPEHLRELEAQGILPIDVVAVNLYPFVHALARGEGGDPARMTEFIDIGGPTMIRAAAKNAAFVLPVIDPADYPAVLEHLAGKGRAGLRAELARKVFVSTASYDLAIARYLGTVTAELPPDAPLGPVGGVVLEREQELRYGENPHQRAAFYRPAGAHAAAWRQLGGKELSYNNFIDVEASFRMLGALAAGSPAAVIVKHTNPCGVAVRDSLLEALRAAKCSDPRSHFGGILAFNGEVGADVAAEVREDFAEIVVARSFTPEALDVLRTSKTLRIIELSEPAPVPELRSALGGVLVQEPDVSISGPAQWELAAGTRPDARGLSELELAWRICVGVKSNAIVLVKDGMLIGAGAGQMSRIDSVELALSKARTHGHDLRGAVAASDAFFPFTDNVESLAGAGIGAIVVPSGAKRDAEVAAAAAKAGIALFFAPDRHFRH